MTIRECMSLFLMNCSSYSANDTIVHYQDNLYFFATYIENVYGTIDFDIDKLTKNDFVGYIIYHRKRGVKNVSVKTYARAIKVFLRYCYFEGYMSENITLNVKLPKADKRLVMPLTVSRVMALDNYILRGRMRFRNIAIFHLMLDCGLRRGEVVRLNIEDINFADSYITIVDSKCSKSRVVPLPCNVANMIKEYLALSSRTSGVVFMNEFLTCPLSCKAIDNIFARLKPIDKYIHPHLLRHTFGTSFMLGGGSLEVLRVLMGHSDYNVTKEYLHLASQGQILNLDIYKLDDIFFRIYNYNKDKE